MRAFKIKRKSAANHCKCKVFDALSWRHHPDSDRGLADLQSTALPLGYGAIFYFVVSPRSKASRGNGAGNEIRTRYLHLGKVALCQMSYARILYAPGNGKRPCWGSRGAALRGNLGASGRNRTNDTRIFSPLLYQLSYRGV